MDLNNGSISLPEFDQKPPSLLNPFSTLIKPTNSPLINRKNVRDLFSLDGRWMGGDCKRKQDHEEGFTSEHYVLQTVQ